MLILARRLNESLLIGPEITVKVIRIDEHRVTLGITAPANVTIDREEVAESKRRGGLTPTPRTS